VVQAVTANQMPAKLAAAWQQATAAVIEAGLPADPKAPETWALFAVLLPHAQTALTDDSDGMRKAPDYLGYSGNHTPARDLYQRVLDAVVRAAQPLPLPRPAIEHPTERHLHRHGVSAHDWPPSCAPRTAQRNHRRHQ
jgi:hypothetical protein